jgi:hypothetical protein
MSNLSKWNLRRVGLLLLSVALLSIVVSRIYQEVWRDPKSIFGYIFFLVIAIAWTRAISTKSRRAYVDAHARGIRILGFSMLAVAAAGFGLFIAMSHNDLPAPIPTYGVAWFFFALAFVGWMVAMLPDGHARSISISKVLNKFLNNQPEDKLGP